MAKRKTTSTKIREDKAEGRTLARAGDVALSYDWSTYNNNEVPGGDTSNASDKSVAFAKARLVSRTNYWLRSYFLLKRFILNYGFQIEVAGTKKGKKLSEPTPKDVQALADWMESDIPPATFYDKTQALTMGVPTGVAQTNREVILKFVEDAWQEFLLMDNCIGFWMETSTSPVILPIERCRYNDYFGVETVFFSHGLSTQQLKFFPPEVVKRFARPEIPLDFTQGEFFKVLKWEMTGSGLSWPSIQSVFRDIGTSDSMERGESTYAYTGRLKFRHHKMGHLIPSGPLAGKSSYHWKLERAKAVQDIFEKKDGFLGDFTSNFDHVIEFPHEDIAYYDEKKWSSTEHRFSVWGGPVAMLMTKGEAVLPFLSQFLRAEAVAYRQKMGSFLESVLNRSMKIPVKIKITWSDMIFSNAQLMSDMLKTALSSGAMTQSTFRQAMGVNDAQEKAKKIAEAEEAKKNPEYYRPAYDPNHGDPAALAGDGSAAPKGGKPPGRPDNPTTATGE